MIKFVICEDNPHHQKKIKTVLEKVLIPSDIEYQSLFFNDISPELEAELKIKDSKVYIIDIELPSGSGIDIATTIRENDDWNSYIIINSIHYQLAHNVFKKKLLIFDFINKFNNFEKELTEDLRKILTLINHRQCLCFKSDGIIYRITINDIVKLEYDSQNKHVVINSLNNVYYITTSLNQLKKQLDNRFIEVYRGIIINKNHITSMDLTNDYIYLINNLVVENVSRSTKKELKQIEL